MKEFLRRLLKLPSVAYLNQGIAKFLAGPGNIDRQTLIMQHQYVDHLLAQPRYSEPKRLHRFEHQVFSQNGEDGVLAEIFRRIGTTDRSFLEIGVGDGLENNTAYLLAQGWKGWWLDGDHEGMEKIQNTFWQPLAGGALKIREALITAENISGILKEL